MTDSAIQWAKHTADGRLAGFESAAVIPLRAEASFRAFYRLEPRPEATGADSLILMVSPPEKEQNDQFERLASVFGRAGLPVPEIVGSQKRSGWYLMTDLGRRELGEAYGTPAERAGLEAALRALITLQSVTDPAIAPYTGARLHDELGIFTEWFADGLMGLSIPAALAPVFENLVGRMVNQPQCCVHRDYHCRNLLFDPATGALGIVDFQDALMGPVSYDPASLLHDCYHRFSDRDVDHWLNWYLQHTPFELDPDRFTSDVTMTAVQRQLKAVGIFSRLRLRDGKVTHLPHILPVLDSLAHLSGREPALRPLSDWLRQLDRNDVRTRIQALERRTAPA